MKTSIYSSEQEEKIYLRRQAATWKRSRLIREDQFSSIKDAADPELQQTNLFFRILFFIFTLLGAGAVVGLIVWIIADNGGAQSQKTAAAFTLAASIAYFVLADLLVKAHRLYRYGIEEALLMAGMFCFVIGILVLIGDQFTRYELAIAACVLFAILAGLIYLRYGYLYMAAISLVSLCAVPFQFHLPPVAERLLLTLILSGAFVFGLAADKTGSEDFRKHRQTIMLACLLIAIYFTVNLELLGLIGLITRETHAIYLYPKLYPPYLYWSSYVLSFIIPTMAIIWGIKSRKRLILNVSLVMACATLATNKSYLGMTRFAWDPAILGFALIALSLLVSRWLDRGPNKARHGFTAENILKPEDHGVGLADVAAALTPGIIGAGQPLQKAPDKVYEAGASGGGGAERKF